MNIATPAAQSSVGHSSTSTLSHSPSDAAIPKDAALSIGKAPNGSSLVHSILEAYGKEILEFASDQFLDLAIAMRLKTINARELVRLLAEAERLGYSKTDIIDDEDNVCPVQVACEEGSQSRLDAIATSKPPATIDVQCHPISKPSSQPPSLENYQTPERTNTAHVRQGGSLSMNEHLNSPDPSGPAPPEKERSCGIHSIQGAVSRRDRISTAARAAGRQRRRECSRVGSGPRVAAHVTKSSNVLKRPRAQQIQDGGVHMQSRHPTKLVKTSAARQSSLTSAKQTELVIISDSEPEPEHYDDN